MLQDKEPKEIVEFFKEKLSGSMAEFQLAHIYYRAKDKEEDNKKRSDLEDIAKIKSFEIEREVIIDENNAVFETKNKKGEMHTVIVINGEKSSNGYYTLEQGLLGWICEKQGFQSISWHLFRMLNMNDK